ncbi:XRE family transcriptional regulator [Paenibacillus sp. UMB4589-SE434]|uniref:XRE family transcriptional regulator n=1 Tax=Paenibacillus sp. UMB4589-SE434 TaxID=3046314 RepID=UPI0025502870|nr:XRE family transcriptional regulator [Paenibacillus sp. UMB4589-SE434]MDK8182134.1 XRE family transcriptional regulator [Paenibacillus sp. UMB4589-SE434]
MLKNKFNGLKLEQARKIRNLTLQEVAELTGISHQSISKYEKNRAIPSVEMIHQLAEILCFETTFFYSEEISANFFENAFIYRSKASVAKKYKDQTENQIGMIYMLVKYIKTHVNLPTFDASLIRENLAGEFMPTRDEDIEELASSIRKKFGLSDGPIGNLTTLCEKLGVNIFYLNMNHQGIDACSVLVEDTPYIILNKDITSAVRIRFNIAHELGHIILHSRYTKKVFNKVQHSKRMEYEANRFASSLLLPESGVAKDLTALGLDYLVMLKKHWMVSVQAIVYRAEQLELFTPEYCLYLRQQISRKKWRNKEPFDDEIPLEIPKLFGHAINYLNDKFNISVSQISFQSGIKEREIFELCNLDAHSINSSPLPSQTNHIRRIK